MFPQILCNNFQQKMNNSKKGSIVTSVWMKGQHKVLTNVDENLNENVKIDKRKMNRNEPIEMSNMWSDNRWSNESQIWYSPSWCKCWLTIWRVRKGNAITESIFTFKWCQGANLVLKRADLPIAEASLTFKFLWSNPIAAHWLVIRANNITWTISTIKKTYLRGKNNSDMKTT